jgi:hypothetical protein
MRSRAVSLRTLPIFPKRPAPAARLLTERGASHRVAGATVVRMPRRGRSLVLFRQNLGFVATIR